MRCVMEDVFGDGEVGEKGLERRHRREGYVDGLARGQEAEMQRGFDEGYGVGAELGKRVGRLLGGGQGGQGGEGGKGGQGGDGEQGELETGGPHPGAVDNTDSLVDRLHILKVLRVEYLEEMLEGRNPVVDRAEAEAATGS